LEEGEDIVCIIGNNELYATSTALFGTLTYRGAMAVMSYKKLAYNGELQILFMIK